MNDFFESAAKAFGLCGHGKQNNWSVKVTDWLFVDCGCCWVWRGIMLGFMVGVPAGVVIASIVHDLSHFGI